MSKKKSVCTNNCKISLTGIYPLTEEFLMLEKINRIEKEIVALIVDARTAVKSEKDAHIRSVQGTDINLAEQDFATAIEYFRRALDTDLLSCLRPQEEEVDIKLVK